MRILLLGEYSNVHHTLALGLRALGHDVTVASSGDSWKDYPRDVDLKRKSFSTWGGFKFWIDTWRKVKHFKDYDIVQLISPEFLDLRAERIWPFYQFLRKHNRKVVMGAFGMDFYYIKACLDFHTFRYSDFNFGEQERHSAENDLFKRDWLNGTKSILNQKIAMDCDAIVAGLYEYYAAYMAHFAKRQKLHFIPFPIIQSSEIHTPERPQGAPLRIFIGIQRQRSVYKGTDIMLRAARRVAAEYPQACQLQVAENVPFAEYVKLMEKAEVVLDQLYSYTPAMNALEAMAHGLVNIGGAEPESYKLLHEEELRPIVNVQPNEQSVYEALCQLVERRDELIPKLQYESYLYIQRHHDYITVARRYEQLYQSL